MSLFFTKRFHEYKNKNQTNHFLRSFYVQNIAAFVFCLLNFIFFVGFHSICVFVRAKSFCEKNKLVWDCPDNLILLYY